MGSSFWEYLAANPDRSSIFDGAMRAVEETEKRAIVVDGGLGEFDVVVDVGGGYGGLVAELLDLYPHLSGVIVDRDSVIDAAYTKWLTRPALAQYLEAKRISFEVGDIFVRESQLNLELSSILPGQRVAIILKHILHDWNAADSLIILRNVAKAMPAGASLILIERILDQDATFVGDQGSFISSQLILLYLALRNALNPRSTILFPKWVLSFLMFDLPAQQYLSSLLHTRTREHCQGQRRYKWSGNCECRISVAGQRGIDASCLGIKTPTIFP